MLRFLRRKRERVNEQVRWVASSIKDADTSRGRAEIAAGQLGPQSIKTLRKLRHSESTPPAELAAEFAGLGDWLYARQCAIIEVFY